MPTRWWTDTTAVALLGTGRRPPAPLPEELGVAARDAAAAEELLLDAAALGGLLVRAGHVPASYDDRPPAPADDRPAAPDRAVQLLQLLLTQPPVGARLATAALARWLAVAAAHGCRVPHAELPRLLALATRTSELRPRVAAVVDARGRWLATANPDWSWLRTVDAGGAAVAAAARPPGRTDDWATLTTAERVAVLGPLRAADPAAGRALVESTWSTESARDRPVLLGALRIGLGPDDEDLLERALDDRAAGVRDVAQKLLDRLPGSARAGRMAERLRPLVRTTGRLRRSLEIDLPGEPDPAAVRDGLGRRPGNRSSERGFWLEQLAAGAPLDVWTDATGRGPAETWRLVDRAGPDARGGVVRAAVCRHDAAWLRAMVESGDTSLLKQLPAEDALLLAVTSLAAVPGYDLAPTLQALPGPWSRRLGDAVLDRLAAEKHPGDLLTTTLPLLADRLPAEALPRLQRWAGADGAPRVLADLVQYLSFVPAIPEAFG